MPKTQGKRKRIPFGGHRTKLQVEDKIPGYRLYWVNDIPGRLGEAQDGGYEFVGRDEVGSVGQGALHQENTDLNNKVSRVVSRDGMRAYLMKIKDEYHKEDLQAKEEVNQRVDEALRQGTPGGNVVDNQYVPKGHVQQV